MVKAFKGSEKSQSWAVGEDTGAPRLEGSAAPLLSRAGGLGRGLGVRGRWPQEARPALQGLWPHPDPAALLSQSQVLGHRYFLSTCCGRGAGV